MAVLVQNILIIGAGLIGGSLAKGLRQRGHVAEVAGYGRNQDSLQKGIQYGVLDKAVSDLPAAIAEADLIVLGVPTLTIAHYLDVIETHRKPESVVTDVASVKGEIAEVLIQHFGSIPPWFVLGHPIAGSEKSGITASNPDLYVNHKVILTPDDNTDKTALALVTDIWEALGAGVVCMPIDEHDQVLAATSHLPHALAFALVDALVGMDSRQEIFRFAAGGFRDFTRIAGSHPVMWHDIMLANKEAVLSVMGVFRSKLDELETIIRKEDGESMLAMFERAKEARDDFGELLEERKSRTAEDRRLLRLIESLLVSEGISNEDKRLLWRILASEEDRNFTEKEIQSWIDKRSISLFENRELLSNVKSAIDKQESSQD